MTNMIELLNHELFLQNKDDVLEVCVSMTDGSSLELWNRVTGEMLEAFDDEAEAAFQVESWVSRIEAAA